MNSSGTKHLTENKYQKIYNALQTQISGPFKIKQLTWRTKCDKSVVRAAIRRLQKEGKIIAYDKCGDGTISYIKMTDVPKIQDKRFNKITEEARQKTGDQEFTASLIARSLNISFEEAGVWFRQAGETGILLKPREESHWAKFLQEESMLSRNANVIKQSL